jgi:ubiquinol-cytochrome c reductase cytochrome b subunit
VPILWPTSFKGLSFYPVTQLIFWTLVSVVIILTWIGARPVEDPYILVGQVLTGVYFLLYLLVPASNALWDELLN